MCQDKKSTKICVVLMTQICSNPKWLTLQATSTNNGHIFQTNRAIDLNLVSKPMFSISKNAFNPISAYFCGNMTQLGQLRSYVKNVYLTTECSNALY